LTATVVSETVRYEREGHMKSPGPDAKLVINFTL